MKRLTMGKDAQHKQDIYKTFKDFVSNPTFDSFYNILETLDEEDMCTGQFWKGNSHCIRGWGMNVMGTNDFEVKAIKLFGIPSGDYLALVNNGRCTVPELEYQKFAAKYSGIPTILGRLKHFTLEQKKKHLISETTDQDVIKEIESKMHEKETVPVA